MNNNILLQTWEYPPFDKIKAADFYEAVRAAIDEAEERIQAIITNPAPPTFENTIEALEVSDQHLRRIMAVLENLDECCTSEELQAATEALTPEVSAFSSRTMANQDLFLRVKQVHDNPPPLDTEAAMLLENTYRSFVRHGALLSGSELDRYLAIEVELTRLRHDYARHALADQGIWVLHLTSEADLAGLPQSLIIGAREEAEQRHMEGYVFTLDQPMYGPFMAHSRLRPLREKMYRAYSSIGNRGNENDNNHIALRIAALRCEQAQLLGFPTYCDYVAANRMAESRQRIEDFEHNLVEAMLDPARKDLHRMEELRDFDGEVMPWDVSYLSERLRQRDHNLDSESLRPYFPLETVQQGIFSLYESLYGVHFEEVKGIPIYHPDVKVYRVSDSHPLGLLYLDLHPRPSKRSGAWMTEFRGQHGAVRPQVQVVCNFSKPTSNTPALLLFSEVETFMHEMGHAMHGLLSQVRYESLSGTNVKRDFVEMPSQLMEHWCYEPEFLRNIAHHYQSGMPLPAEAIAKLRAARGHIAAWLCLRQLNLGLTDLAFHTLRSPEEATRAVSAEAIEAAAMHHLVPRVEGCCTATHFSHIFSGGYAAGYYGYKWAQVLDCDIFSRFREEGLFNAHTADRFRRTILERGGTQTPAILFRSFMGRDPNPDALINDTLHPQD